MRVSYPQLIFLIKYAIIYPGGQDMVSPETAGIVITLFIVAVVLAVAFVKSNRKNSLHPVYLKSLGDDHQHLQTPTARPS